MVRNEGLSVTPRTYVLKKAQHGGAGLESQCWGGRDKSISRPRGPGSLASLASSRSMRDLSLKIIGLERWLTIKGRLTTKIYKIKYGGLRTGKVAQRIMMLDAKPNDQA